MSDSQHNMKVGVFKEFQERIFTAETRQKEAEDRLKAIRKDKDQYVADRDAAIAKAKEAEETLEAQGLKYNEALELIEKLKSEKESLIKTISERDFKVTSYEMKIKERDEMIKDKDNQLTASKKKISSLEAEIKEEKSSKVLLNNEIKELTEKNQDLQNKYADKNDEFESLSNTIALKNKEVKSMKAARDKAIESFEKYKKAHSKEAQEARAEQKMREICYKVKVKMQAKSHIHGVDAPGGSDPWGKPLEKKKSLQRQGSNGKGLVKKMSFHKTRFQQQSSKSSNESRG